MATSSKAILGFMVTSLTALSPGCAKEGLTSGHTDAGSPPPGADAAVADLAPDGQLGSDVASGGTILVGAPCPSPVMNSCRPIPAGVQKLADDLQSLANTALAAQPAACAGL